MCYWPYIINCRKNMRDKQIPDNEYGWIMDGLMSERNNKFSFFTIRYILSFIIVRNFDLIVISPSRRAVETTRHSLLGDDSWWLTRDDFASFETANCFVHFRTFSVVATLCFETTTDAHVTTRNVYIFNYNSCWFVKYLIGFSTASY